MRCAELWRNANVVPLPFELRETDFCRIWTDIPDEILKEAKFMIVSYPLNPVCVCAPDSFYKELIAFAKKYEIIILHDNAYSDIVYTGEAR